MTNKILSHFGGIAVLEICVNEKSEIGKIPVKDSDGHFYIIHDI